MTEAFLSGLLSRLKEDDSKNHLFIHFVFILCTNLSSKIHFFSYAPDFIFLVFLIRTLYHKGAWIDVSKYVKVVWGMSSP